jgi:hypothetical protein
MKLRDKLLLAFAGFHLLLVTMGATGLQSTNSSTAAGDLVSAYSALSGADNGYGFFSAVGAQHRTRFFLTDKHGKTWSDNLELGGNSEASMRFTGISNLLPSMTENDRLAVYRSMAATMFGRHPNAESVAVRMDVWGFDQKGAPADYPSMQQFRDGVRPKWLPVEEVTFTRNETAEKREELTEK